MKGKLDPGRCIGATPVDAPLYPRPPYPYKDAEAFTITWQTDAEAAAALLPEVLELPDTPTAMLMFVRYPFSALGPYEEAILGIHCLLQGQPRLYIPHIVVNSDAPLAAGREVYGYPKKLAAIRIENDGDGLWGQMERPKGHLICSAGIRLEQRHPVSGESSDGYSLSLRVIPHPAEGETPSLAELVETHSTSTQKDLWSGTGWVTFHSESTLDPWHRVPVRQVLSATYSVYDFVLGFGRTIG